MSARAAAARSVRDAEAVQTRRRVLEAMRAVLPPGARAWLIGSLAWGGFGERSDVDIVVALLPEETQLALERAVVAAAGREVDVLELGALSADFRARVVAEGVAVDG